MNRKPSASRSGLSEAMMGLSINGSGRKRAARGAHNDTLAFQCFSIMFTYPYLIYKFFRGGRLKARVNFLVPSMNEESFIPKVTEDGKHLSLQTLIPDAFHDPGRVNMAKVGIDNMFNNDTHEHTSFTEAVDQLHVATGHEDGDQPIQSPEQIVPLPFVCEREISGWEVLFVPNDNKPDGFPENVAFYHAILSVELVSIEKKTMKKKGSACIIGSPTTGPVPAPVPSFPAHLATPYVPSMPPQNTNPISVASAPLPRQKSATVPDRSSNDVFERIGFPKFPVYTDPDATQDITKADSEVEHAWKTGE